MGGLGSSSKFWTGNRYGLEPLHQCGKRVKIKSQKVLGANSQVCRSYRRKADTGRGAFWPSPSWIGLTKVLFVALRDKKSSHDDIKENLRFKQSRFSYMNNRKKKKEHIRLVISSIRVGVVAKTADEIYVLRTIKVWSYFSFVSSDEIYVLDTIKILC